jgi:hypothetical protein
LSIYFFWAFHFFFLLFHVVNGKGEQFAAGFGFGFLNGEEKLSRKNRWNEKGFLTPCLVSFWFLLHFILEKFVKNFYERKKNERLSFNVVSFVEVFHRRSSCKLPKVSCFLPWIFFFFNVLSIPKKLYLGFHCVLSSIRRLDLISYIKCYQS